MVGDGNLSMIKASTIFPASKKQISESALMLNLSSTSMLQILSFFPKICTKSLQSSDSYAEATYSLE